MEQGSRATIELNIRDFMYKKQFQRKMNPLFIILTKEGLIFIISSIITYKIMGGGIVWLLVFAFAGKYIYKEKFKYQYHEFENLWVIRILSSLKNKRKFVSHEL